MRERQIDREKKANQKNPDRNKCGGKREINKLPIRLFRFKDYKEQRFTNKYHFYFGKKSTFVNLTSNVVLPKNVI